MKIETKKAIWIDGIPHDPAELVRSKLKQGIPAMEAVNDLAAQIGAAQTTVYRWLSGASCPSPAAAKKLIDLP